MYKVVMVNFGLVKYEGNDEQEAFRVAGSLGFETAVYCDGVLTNTYSPVGGWVGYF
jgi:hypothetical protein